MFGVKYNKLYSKIKNYILVIPITQFIIKRFIPYLKKHRFISMLLIMIILCYAIFFILWILFPLPVDKIENGYSRTIVFKDGKINYVSLNNEGALRIFTPSEKIPKHIKKYFIGYEDRYYYYHFGINPISIVRAAIQNIRNKKIVSGASTISMQVARMIEKKERNFLSKIIEAFRAFQLEWKYSKNELLNIYLNLIPLGGNLEGIGSGAYFYFNKSPDALSVGEIAVLIGIPRSPNYARPDINPENAENVKRKILNRLFKQRIINKNEYNSAIKTKIRKRRYSPLFMVPHLTVKLLKEENNLITLTIDREKQLICENIVAEHRESLNNLNIKNIGILVVNSRTGDIEAWVGGFEYENKNEGMIDAITIKRSPGSTLKPFLYGSAIDAGIITPKTVIYDVKRYYAGYNVANYDKIYRGPVNATEALTASLNSPAVYLLSKLTSGSLLPIIDSLGYSSDSVNESLGLSVALGAKEISLFDLVKNYSLFCNKGRIINIRYADSKVKAYGKRVISEEAAFLISEMLSEGSRLDLPRSWEFTVRKSKVAWKTGTSFGNYDALCVGYNADYIIGVWVGNATRQPSKGLIGSKAAAPIFFQLFNAITYDKNNWFQKPEGIKKRKVSVDSGLIPSEYTKDTISDYYIPGISSMKECEKFKAYYIDINRGLAVVRPEGYKVKKVVYEIYPKEAINWAAKNNPGYKSPPSYAPEQLKYVKSDEKLRILSPLKDNIYYINKHLSYEQQKINLLAESYADTKTLYWFVNNTLLTNGSVKSKYYLNPKPGKYKIMCIDDKGRTGSVKIAIKLIK